MPSKTKSQQREPEDKDAAELVEIQYRGRTFTVPKDMDEWETEACIAFYRASTTRLLEDAVLASKLVLGDNQWKQVQELGTKRRDTKEFLGVLLDTINSQCDG